MKEYNNFLSSISNMFKEKQISMSDIINQHKFMNEKLPIKKNNMEIIMYSAESTLQDINAVDDLQHKIDCIKEYGKQCAKQALKDAAENAMINISSFEGFGSFDVAVYSDGYGDTIKVNKELITNTEILTP